MWLWGFVWSACAEPLDDSAASRQAVAQVAPGFWDAWGDGQAELDAYRLTTRRYGELRRGEAVQVWVTETFTDATRVKSDGGHPDEFPVLKLNDRRAFQTGIYDYSVMTSVFARIDGRAALGEPVKVSMTMSEWCGHVYEQLVLRGGAHGWTSHSYFDGEADREESLPRRHDGLVGDMAPFIARGWVGRLAGSDGSAVTVPYLPTLVEGRVAHRAPSWRTATWSRSAATRELTVPLGTFVVRDVLLDDGRVQTTWSIEEAPPHRIVRWERSDGEIAELVGSERLPYWQLTGEGDERHREALGLPLRRVP